MSDLVERLQSHMGLADMQEVLADCRLAASRISQQDSELERVRRELEALKAGIKRLSDEEELISETGSDEALTAVHLASRLAEAEDLAHVMEAESNQMREVSISNRHRAEAARALAFVEVEQKAREWAEHYPQSSDGRNTFIMFAEWAEEQASSAKAEENGR